MADSTLILGEYRRTVDDRFRLSVPLELVEKLQIEDGSGVLAKERPGCISLWNRAGWQEQLDSNVQLIESRLQANRLSMQSAQLQKLGRLLSTRHRDVPIAGRGRIVIPEGFREFLRVEPGSEVIVIGAAVCIEIWQVDAWLGCLNEQIPDFGELMNELAR